MIILIININKKWIYNLYDEYIISFEQFIKKYYTHIIINILYYDLEIFNIELLKDINFNLYKKIIYCGNIDILNILLKKVNYTKLNYLNIEQLSQTNYYKELRKINKNINIIDYSEENIPFLQNIYNYFLFPPFYELYYITYADKSIDILSICNNEYRKTIFNNINIDTKFNTIILDNCFGKERNEYFNKAKIYINIHGSESHKTMEMIRIVNLICRKVIIISQSTIYSELLFLKDYIIICNDINLFSEYINEILNNYDSYYHKIYNNFDEKYNEYIKYIKKNIDKFMIE